MVKSVGRLAYVKDGTLVTKDYKDFNVFQKDYEKIWKSKKADAYFQFVTRKSGQLSCTAGSFKTNPGWEEIQPENWPESVKQSENRAKKFTTFVKARFWVNRTAKVGKIAYLFNDEFLNIKSVHFCLIGENGGSSTWMEFCD